MQPTTFALILASVAICDVVSLSAPLDEHRFLADADQLPVGEWYKPQPESASGRPGTTAPFRRSPCPALNTLANHGYIPRNGQNIQKDELKAALKKVFNMAEDTVTFQLRQLEDGFSLNFLSRHNAPEHDASLVHKDAYFGQEPMVVDGDLLRDFLGRADGNRTISTAVVAQVRKDRAESCQKSNPECTFGDVEKKRSYFQAALLLEGMGQGNSISANDANSFLNDEKIPIDYVKPSVPVTLAILNAKSKELGYSL